MTERIMGPLEKLRAVPTAMPLEYTLPVGDGAVPLNPLLGQRLSLRHTGRILCVHCGRQTRKSFNQGYCYPCFTRLAQCDTCIIKPELCHFARGTCREPEWAQQFCFQPHVVYLANSSGLKVGITRGTQIPTRWIDQGASQAILLFEVSSRHAAGVIEVALATHLPDKTQWRALLRGPADVLDMQRERHQALETCAALLASLAIPEGAVCRRCDDAPEQRFEYPVVQYPVKVQSMDFDKQPLIEGTLWGVKGQYLLLDTGVINIRKFGGYEVEVTA